MLRCCVVDLRLPDMTLRAARAGPAGAKLRATPVFVFTGKDLNDDEAARLKSLARACPEGRAVAERLFDETILFRIA